METSLFDGVTLAVYKNGVMEKVISFSVMAKCCDCSVMRDDFCVGVLQYKKK